MKREDYWRDEYESASKEYLARKHQYERADTERSVALAAMNRAERELNRLFGLRFNAPGVTFASHKRGTDAT